MRWKEDSTIFGTKKIYILSLMNQEGHERSLQILRCIPFHGPKMF